MLFLQIFILFSSSTGTWPDASSTNESGVTIQAHSKSSAYVSVGHRLTQSACVQAHQLINSEKKPLTLCVYVCIFRYRFVIRRAVVRKDLIQSLPLPRRLLDYLSYKNCYSEQVESDSSPSPSPSIEVGFFHSFINCFGCNN